MTNLEKDIAKMLDEAIGTEPELIYKLLHHMATAAEKTSMHLEENWQDRSSAKAWDKIADVLRKSADKVEKLVPF